MHQGPKRAVMHRRDSWQCCAGQRIQLKASLEGVTFAPAPEASPASASPTSAAAQESPQATQPGKIDKVWDCARRVLEVQGIASVWSLCTEDLLV